jgi:hypothetical protein
MSEREKAFHVIHMVDAIQTWQISQSPCHHESGAAQLFFGENPSEGDVIAWALATSVIYHYAEEKLPDTLMNMNFILKVGVIENNLDEGLSLSGYRC